MRATIRKLPDAELSVMQAAWACAAPATRADIEKKLNEAHPMALTTLLTQLTRLSDKGFLSVQKEGRSNLYTPLISEQDYLAAQGKRFFRQLCGGKVSTFAAALCDSGLTKEDLAELRDLLDKEVL